MAQHRGVGGAEERPGGDLELAEAVDEAELEASRGRVHAQVGDATRLQAAVDRRGQGERRGRLAAVEVGAGVVERDDVTQRRVARGVGRTRLLEHRQAVATLHAKAAGHPADELEVGDVEERALEVAGLHQLADVDRRVDRVELEERADLGIDELAAHRDPQIEARVLAALGVLVAQDHRVDRAREVPRRRRDDVLVAEDPPVEVTARIGAQHHRVALALLQAGVRREHDQLAVLARRQTAAQVAFERQQLAQRRHLRRGHARRERGQPGQQRDPGGQYRPEPCHATHATHAAHAAHAAPAAHAAHAAPASASMSEGAGRASHRGPQHPLGRRREHAGERRLAAEGLCEHVPEDRREPALREQQQHQRDVYGERDQGDRSEPAARPAQGAEHQRGEPEPDGPRRDRPRSTHGLGGLMSV